MVKPEGQEREHRREPVLHYLGRWEVGMEKGEQA